MSETYSWICKECRELNTIDVEENTWVLPKCKCSKRPETKENSIFLKKQMEIFTLRLIEKQKGKT